MSTGWNQSTKLKALIMEMLSFAYKVRPEGRKFHTFGMFESMVEILPNSITETRVIEMMISLKLFSHSYFSL